MFGELSVSSVQVEDAYLKESVVSVDESLLQMFGQICTPTSVKFRGLWTAR